MFVLPIMGNDCLQFTESHRNNMDIEFIWELKDIVDAMLDSLIRHMVHN